MIKFPRKVLEKLENHLKDESKRVLAQIEELRQQDPFSDTSRLTDNAASDTEAKEEMDHERYQALLGELEAKKTAIAGALERIKKGTYGSCLKCGDLIDTDRLNMVPAARYCMNCHKKMGK